MSTIWIVILILIIGLLFGITQGLKMMAHNVVLHVLGANRIFSLLLDSALYL